MQVSRALFESVLHVVTRQKYSTHVHTSTSLLVCIPSACTALNRSWSAAESPALQPLRMSSDDAYVRLHLLCLGKMPDQICDAQCSATSVSKRRYACGQPALYTSVARNFNELCKQSA